jgi:hypothetical protein
VANKSLYFSGGGENGAALRTAAKTESSKIALLEPLVICDEVRLAKVLLRETLKTELIWLKPGIVFGAYSHCEHENLLIATRGSLTPVKKLRSTFEGNCLSAKC